MMLQFNTQLLFHKKHVHHNGVLYYKSGHEQNQNENLFHMVFFNVTPCFLTTIIKIPRLR